MMDREIINMLPDTIRPLDLCMELVKFSFVQMQ